MRRSARVYRPKRKTAPRRKKVTMTEAKSLVSLVNPFTTSSLAPKLLDGKASRTSGFRLRNTGNITCSLTAPTVICLIPGLSNVVCWNSSGSTTVTLPSPFAGHLGSSADRAVVVKARLVSSGLRLTLVNNADQNDGYWEAARLPVKSSDFTVNATTGVVTFTPASTTSTDLSQYQTYQSGKIRDLHRMQFDISSQDDDHEYTSIIEPPTVPSSLDPNWDVVFIKIYGRQGAGSVPTSLMYDAIANQEVVYNENTALSRLMTKTSRSPYYNAMMARQVRTLPAHRIDLPM